jgi:peptide/nickel transport system permease protein
VPPAEGVVPVGAGPVDTTVEVSSAAVAGRTAAEPEAITARRLGWFFWVCVGWLVLVIAGAILAPVLPLQSPTKVATGAVPYELPSIHHWLGTDTLGRDLFSRVVFGARVSLVVGFGSIAIGLFFGGLMGLIAGFFRGPVDAVLTAVANVALSFPALILLLAVVAFLGAHLLNITLAIGVLSVAPIFRVVRGSTVAYADREFVTAARALGASRPRVLFREILPNVVPPTLSYALVFVAVSILAEAALSYLALSVPPPTPTWGSIVAEGQGYLATDPYICLWPAIALFLTVLSLNLVGDRLRAVFDVRESNL